MLINDFEVYSFAVDFGGFLIEYGVLIQFFSWEVSKKKDEYIQAIEFVKQKYVGLLEKMNTTSIKIKYNRFINFLDNLQNRIMYKNFNLKDINKIWEALSNYEWENDVTATLHDAYIEEYSLNKYPKYLYYSVVELLHEERYDLAVIN